MDLFPSSLFFYLSGKNKIWYFRPELSEGSMCLKETINEQIRKKSVLFKHVEMNLDHQPS